MANVRFCVDVTETGAGNWWSASTSTVTALSAASALPVTASQNPDRSYVWRSLSQTADQTIQVDLGGAKSITACVIANPKLQNSGSLKLQWSTDASSWTDVGTFPAMDLATRVTFLCFAALSKRYWRIYSTSGNGAVADYAEIGYVFLGAYFEPTVNYSAPMDVQKVDPSIAGASDDGQYTFTRKTPYFSGSCAFEAWPQADLDAWRAIYQITRTSVPFFLLADLTLSWMNWLVRLTGGYPSSPGDLYGNYDVSLPWEEAR